MACWKRVCHCRGAALAEAASGAADEASEADAIYARLHADAAQWMAGLHGTPLLARNRAAFDRTLRARAAAAAAAQAAAQARLTQTKRIERCSTFLPEPTAADGSGARCVAGQLSAAPPPLAPHIRASSQCDTVPRCWYTTVDTVLHLRRRCRRPLCGGALTVDHERSCVRVGLLHGAVCVQSCQVRGRTHSCGLPHYGH